MKRSEHTNAFPEVYVEGVEPVSSGNSGEAESEDEALDLIRSAMRDVFKIEAGVVLGSRTSGLSLQVWRRTARSRGGWAKAGPFIVPTGGQTVGDILRMLADFADGVSTGNEEGQ